MLNIYFFIIETAVPIQCNNFFIKTKVLLSHAQVTITDNFAYLA
jgi:hypothetical protein